MTRERFAKSSGNVFLDLGFDPEEAAVLAMRSDLMGRLALYIEKQRLTQAEAAKRLGISQSRVSDLVRGKWQRFSIDTLLVLARRAGLSTHLSVAA